MIRLFESGRRILYFPRKWANSVSRWLLGIHSPEGTIRITGNTPNPEGEKSVGFDVNIGTVASKVRARLSALGFTAAQRTAIKSVFRECLDGLSIVWGDTGAKVSKEWLDAIIENAIADVTLPAPDAGTPESLTSGAGVGGASASTDSFTASGSGNGVKFFAVTRSYTNMGVTQLFFREITLAADGRWVSVSGENGSVSVYSV